MEHRMGRRIRKNLTVEVYRGVNHMGEFTLKDIGASGACIKDHRESIHVNDYLRLTIRAAGETSACRNMSAYVVWMKNGHAGLLWAVPEEDCAGLMEFVAARAVA